MLSLVGIVIGIAAALAVVVTGAVVGTCLVIARITDAVRKRPPGGSGTPPSAPPSAGGGYQPGGYPQQGAAVPAGYRPPRTPGSYR